MRVCHVSPHLPPDQAANALLPVQLGTWSRDRGVDVSFVTQPPTQGRPATGGLPGPVHRVRARSSSALSRALRIDLVMRARSIMRALDRAASGADLLHLHSNGLIVEVAAHWAHRRQIPYVLTLYGTEIWHYRKRAIVDPFTRTYQAAGVVTFYSQRLLDKAQDIGLSRPGMRVIYPAVSDAFVRPTEAVRQQWKADLGIKEQLVVLNVKRLHELAGQRFLIDAFARLSHRRADVRLIICGTGPLRAELEQRARDAGVSDRVTFTGLLPNDAIARYAAVADVFALPSLLEALPTVAVESLAAGTPVVSADHPGGLELAQLFPGDVSIVPRQDVERLSDAIGAAVAAPRRVHAATPGIIRDRFGPSAVAAAYWAVYDDVARPGIL